MGPERWGEGGGASSRGNSVGYRQILSQLVEVKGLHSVVETVINILEGQTLQRWEGRWVRRSAAQKQQQAQAAATTAAAASRNRNTSNKKSSNKQQNQEQQK